jgi:hypothetical protein
MTIVRNIYTFIPSSLIKFMKANSKIYIRIYDDL